LAHITELLLGRVTLAAKHRAADTNSCIFIVDNQGRMIASSTGIHDVFCEGSGCAGTQRLWNETSSLLIKQAFNGLHDSFGDLADWQTSGLKTDNRTGYIYSHYQVSSGHSFWGIHWTIIRAQPINAYMGDITEEGDRTELEIKDAMDKMRDDLDHREEVTLILCASFLAVGGLALGCISWLVSRHLRRIAEEMNKVAKLDFIGLDNLRSMHRISDKKRFGSTSMIREVSDIGRSFEDMANGLRSFSRYMDPHVVQILVQSGQQAKLGVAKAKVTVFFSDIANFTAMAETLEPSVLASLLGEYLNAMSSVIMKHRGIVGEFIGDEIMAWWNTPWHQGRKHTVMALSAAMEQQQMLSKMRQRWEEKGLPTVKARMGLVCGQVLAGNIGSHFRMKYGLVGDSVNLASRLEQLCKRYGVSILVDSRTCDEEGVRDRFFLRPVGLVTVKGRSELTELCEVVACKQQVRGTSLQDMYTSFCNQFVESNELYRSRKFQASSDALDAYLKIWPSDKPAMLLKEKCEDLIQNPPGEEWTPVERLRDK